MHEPRSRQRSELHLPGLSRREFLGLGLAAGAGAALSLCGCAGPVRESPGRRVQAARETAPVEGRVVLDLIPAEDTTPGGLTPRGLAHLEESLRLCTDWSWLKPGDSVLLKVACNSGKEHPKVTWPGAVGALVRLLREHRAGTIWVADQSGVEHVRFTPELRFSSTRERMKSNGLLDAIEEAGAQSHLFDEQPWEAWFQPERDFADHWGQDLWLPEILRQTQHVINLPRLGAHATAGYTAGIKIAVGWLRDDSRRALHTAGDLFYERIAEISHFRPLRDKLRLTVTLGTAALLDIGPDLGGSRSFDGALLLAAESLVDHDLAATALLSWADDDTTTFFDVYTPYPEHADYWNRGFVEDIWGKEAARGYRPLLPPRFEQGLGTDVFTTHLAQLQGYRPGRIRVLGTPERWPEGLASGLRGASDLLEVEG